MHGIGACISAISRLGIDYEIVDAVEIDKYAMIHRFYLWYAYKFDMPGFDSKAQENFKKYINEKGNLNLKKLSTDDIMALKEAIARDVDAIEFVQRIAKTGEGSQNAMKKLSDGGASV